MARDNPQNRGRAPPIVQDGSGFVDRFADRQLDTMGDMQKLMLNLAHRGSTRTRGGPVQGRGQGQGGTPQRQMDTYHGSAWPEAASEAPVYAGSKCGFEDRTPSPTPSQIHDEDQHRDTRRRAHAPSNHDHDSYDRSRQTSVQTRRPERGRQIEKSYPVRNRPSSREMDEGARRSEEHHNGQASRTTRKPQTDEDVVMTSVAKPMSSLSLRSTTSNAVASGLGLSAWDKYQLKKAQLLSPFNPKTPPKPPAVPALAVTTPVMVPTVPAVPTAPPTATPTAPPPSLEPTPVTPASVGIVISTPKGKEKEDTQEEGAEGDKIEVDPQDWAMGPDGKPYPALPPSEDDEDV
ncbi:hypothetical protein C8J57DRAFT_1406841 [Mycena rebaudengoi]|nr:hypothetical protein C8J57DRAFT_1406841 [Mycena rebaudengoi]